jgi:hypothetical protein
MTWPSTSPDLELADAMRAAIESMPEWMELEPLADSVVSVSWPLTTVDGPRALVHPPQISDDATARDARLPTTSVVIEVHVPVDAREALAALGTLRRAIGRIKIAGLRIMSASITAFERGKYVSSTAASASTSSSTATMTPSTPDAASPAWSRSSAVAHRGEITVKLFQVPFPS